MLVPENARNLESKELQFEPDEEGLSLDQRRSPGMMLEDGGKAVEDQNKALEEARGKTMSPGKLEKIQTGNFIVYTLPGRTKECTVGKVISLSRAEQTAVVHRHKPCSDNHLRLHWWPAFLDDGVEVLGSGKNPSLESVPIRQILFGVQLNDGVIGHAMARRLDKAGYRYETAWTGDRKSPAAVDADGKVVMIEGPIPDDDLSGAIGALQAQPSEPRLGPAAGARTSLS